MAKLPTIIAGIIFAMPAFASPMADISTVDRVWSGHAVNFALAVSAEAVFVGYYDADRRLTVASRPIDESEWLYQKLDVVTGWDSHNYIAMALDSAGNLHVTGNMHNDPLVYFRTVRAGDVRSLKRVAVLVDPRVEQRMTYPVFIKHAGRLILKYRDGGSGNGNEIYNEYDAATQHWRALLTTPLVDGEGQRNAYFVGPTSGPDGQFHLAWVWRETPDAETNHDLSYARSRDLVNWQKSDGTPLALPIKLNTAEIVDPVPVGAGMINNNTVIGFDAEGRVMITYHKFDAHGFTQIFVARREPKRWNIRQISDWRGFRWDFRGRGSLHSRLFVEGAVPESKDRLRVSVIRDGTPLDLLIDAHSIALIEERPGSTLSNRLRTVLPVPPGMQLNTVEDSGGSGFAIAWATRPPQRDLPGEHIPEPTTLHLVMPR
jgi:hypothetical protein